MTPRGVALAHATWFHVPALGMTAAEILAQGSAFVTRVASGAAYAVTSGHVAAPHRWRQYYPSAEYLAHVEDSHCETRLGMRSIDGAEVGAPLQRVPLPKGYAHSQLDLAAFAMHSSNVLQLRDESPRDGERLYVHGHVLRGVDGVDGVVPTSTSAFQVGRDGARIFARTSETCEMGMCGGPVLDAKGLVVGILEGVVPPLVEGDSPKSELHACVAGTAAFISSDELSSFLEDVDRTERANTVTAKRE